MTGQSGGTQTTVTVPSATTTTAVLAVGSSHVCQIPGTVTFDTARSFVKPTASNKNALLDVLAFAFSPNPTTHSHLLLVGHTDSPGSTTTNNPLSERRARSVHALLTGSFAEWETLFTTERWSTPELTEMVVETGEAPRGDSAAIAAAIARYRGTSAAAKSARADLFRRYFDALLGRTGPPPINFVAQTPPWLGCGEDHLLRGSPSSPVRDPSLPPITGDFEPNRRVEFFFVESTLSIPIRCAEYPNWTLACSLSTPPPAVVEWFVSQSLGRDAVGHGVDRIRPFKTIQFAIDHVSSLSLAGTNVINVMAGTYQEDVGLASNIVLKADTRATPMLVRATPGSPVILCDAVSDVRIEGLVITGLIFFDGRGIHIRNSRNVTVQACTISLHRSDGHGGGILIESSHEVEVTGGRIGDNFATRGGGIAIVDSNKVTVEDVDIEKNRAGRIETAVTAVDIDVTVFGNLDTFTITLGDAHGGGVYLQDSEDVFIRNNRIRENTAILFGGGIAVDNQPGFTGVIVIDGNEIVCNQVAHGNLQPLQSPSVSCNEADMNDPLLDRMEEETIDKIAAEAIDLLHGVGIESGLGGGIALRHVSPATRLLNNRIGLQNRPNRARRGGGIECFIGAYPHIEGNTIAFNLSSGDGGGIAIDQFDPFLPANQSTFLGFRRGTFFPRQLIRLVNNQIRFNRCAQDGGGLYATGNAQVEISGSNTLIEGNQAGENGGGIRISYATNLVAREARVIKNQSRVIGNEKEAGGGIAARNSEFQLRDCLFEGNIVQQFAGGAVFCNSANEGGFNEGGFRENEFAQFDEIMATDYGFGIRRYRISNCRGSDNQATGSSGTGGFLYAVRNRNLGGRLPMEILIDGSSTAIGVNTSEYNNASRFSTNPMRLRGNVVIELSGRLNASGLPEDRVHIFGDVPSVPTGVALSTPSPDDRAVVIFHGDSRPDDHPTTFPYSNIALTITNVQPRFGSVNGGTPITITGQGFIDDPTTLVFIGGQLAGNIQVLSEREITAETPPVVGPGPVDVEVQNADGQRGRVSGGFEYTLPPQINVVQPPSGFTTGGELVVITGSDFLSGIEVFFAGTSATSVTFISDTEIEAVTPPLPTGLPPGFHDLEVVNPDKQSDRVLGGFQYLAPPPHIIHVQPRSGPSAGGTPITITGTNFQSGASVNIANASASFVNVVSSSEITAETPPLPIPLIPGPVDITVVNPDGQDETVRDGFTYTP